MTAVSVLREFFAIFSWFVLAYTVFINITYYLNTILAFFAVRKHLRTRSRERLEQIFNSRLVPPISVILTAYNEEATIVDSVRGILRQLYSQYEVIVVNDGSKDGTLQQLIESFSMERVEKTYDESIPTQPVRGVYASYEYPRLIVVDKENGGCKADASNAGINAANYPLFCAADADSLLEEDALLQLVLPMLERLDFVPATGGVVRAANGSNVQRGTLFNIGLGKRPIEVFQVIEYLRAFLTGRTAQSVQNIMLIVSGAFGLFNKALVKTIGGYNKDSLGEDFELVVRMAKHLHGLKTPFSVVFVPQTVCWTMVPHDWTTLGKQRARWHRGLMQTLQWHANMVLNPAYGRTGVLGMGYFLLVEALGPCIELLGYLVFPISVVIGAINLPSALLFFLISVFGGVFLSLSALLLEEVSFHRYSKWDEIERLAIYAFLENFGYRQLTLWWRTKGLWNYMTGKKHAWGSMARQSFGSGSV
ncbi:MAG TPA: glycosyltransferase [Candidatus Baltobacteraceae bacterium]|nr:glycosyltransferase [Candidatus Baltobacteraceae bacterium]